jgi:hypothetical protein
MPTVMELNNPKLFERIDPVPQPETYLKVATGKLFFITNRPGREKQVLDRAVALVDHNGKGGLGYDIREGKEKYFTSQKTLPSAAYIRDNPTLFAKFTNIPPLEVFREKKSGNHYFIDPIDRQVLDGYIVLWAIDSIPIWHALDKGFSAAVDKLLHGITELAELSQDPLAVLLLNRFGICPALIRTIANFKSCATPMDLADELFKLTDKKNLATFAIMARAKIEGKLKSTGDILDVANKALIEADSRCKKTIPRIKEIRSHIDKIIALDPTPGDDLLDNDIIKELRTLVTEIEELAGL